MRELSCGLYEPSLFELLRGFDGVGGADEGTLFILMGRSREGKSRKFPESLLLVIDRCANKERAWHTLLR